MSKFDPLDCIINSTAKETAANAILCSELI